MTTNPRRFSRRAATLAVAAVLVCVLVAAAAIAADTAATPVTSPRDVAALAKSSLIYIATVRKDGNQSTAAPVWFITTADHQVLIETSPKSWKAKRIKRGSPALIWIGERTGPAFIGRAEIVADTKLQDQVLEEYPKKYMLARIGYARPTRAKLDSGQIVVIRIAPVRDFPDGFQSQPGTPAPSLDTLSKPAPTR
ncbi:MAG TPA: pyridoxamine 5'-phosphate oxidase family protein [Candidatus Acidoferrales bacterium]|nr:pyridoxamine 5'-phosphate oxidase family protein [Candidatus Acidoferrales bacterium]